MRLPVQERWGSHWKGKSYDLCSRFIVSERNETHETTDEAFS